MLPNILAVSVIGITGLWSQKCYHTPMTQRTEEFKVNGEDLLARVKALINEGNIRKISILNKEGKKVIELPLTVGVVGAVIAPALAAVGAIAALLSECTIVVVRETDDDKK